MCTYMPLGTNEMNSVDTSEMNTLDTNEINLLNASKVNAPFLVWALSRTSCISNLILKLN